ncbi:MAG: hypothetical protein WAK53_17685 [Chromatiaceae bacterium]|jgi:hypothetical protein
MLRLTLLEAMQANGLNMSDLTVLAPQRDPYRLDTPANHIFGKWLADAYARVKHSIIAQRIHLRGLHYLFVGRVTLPNGSPYTNTDENWLFLSEKAIKAARHLGYVPWCAIRDARNSPPRVFTPEHEPPVWTLRVGEIELYLPDELAPRLQIVGNLSRQPWRQVVIAEKQGVEDLLLPVCRTYKATLALPAGEVSETMVYDLLAEAADDGRPLAVHQLGDCDPAGFQMAVSTARHIQAIREEQFPDLEVRVYAPALTIGQANQWDLPSSPLKAGEGRADRWLAAFAREQTELDAAVALAGNELVAVVRSSLAQHWDATLARREADLRERLERQANERLAAQLGPENLAAIREQAEGKLAELQDLVAEINDALRVDASALDLEMPEEPEVLVGDVNPDDVPLFDSSEDWVTATRKLKSRKRY